MKTNLFTKIITFGPTLAKFFRNSAIGLRSKVLVVFAILYILSPFDILPDFIPFVGWVEDIIIAVMTFLFVNSQTGTNVVPTKNRERDVINIEAKVIEEEN